MRPSLSAALALCLAAVAGCASAARPDTSTAGYALRDLGEPYATHGGHVFLIRVQDEYRLIRCIPDGPIAGCYEDVFTVPRGNVAWNQWLAVDRVPGLRVRFVSPTRVALREEAPYTPDLDVRAR